MDWHHTTRKCVIKSQSLIAVTAKECWPEQEYSNQVTHSLISFSYVHMFILVFMFLLFLLLLSCYPSLYSTFATHFPCSSHVIFVGDNLTPFISHWLFFPSLCLLCFLPCKPSTSVWTECPQKPRVKFNRIHLSVQKIWNDPILVVGASWQMQIKSDDFSRGLKWKVWASP